MAWISSGRITNPTLNQVLVDTGPLAAKERIFQAVSAATANAPLELQHVAADGTTVLRSQILACTAFGTGWFPSLSSELNMAINERLRIIAVTAITGSVSCSLDYTA